MPNLSALVRAMSKASTLASQAQMRQSGLSRAKASAIAPLPVPKSAIAQGADGNFVNASSTNNSVSGRGINVAGETVRSSDQNSRRPVK